MREERKKKFEESEAVQQDGGEFLAKVRRLKAMAAELEAGVQIGNSEVFAIGSRYCTETPGGRILALQIFRVGDSKYGVDGHTGYFYNIVEDKNGQRGAKRIIDHVLLTSIVSTVIPVLMDINNYK